MAVVATLVRTVDGKSLFNVSGNPDGQFESQRGNFAIDPQGNLYENIGGKMWRTSLSQLIIDALRIALKRDVTLADVSSYTADGAIAKTTGLHELAKTSAGAFTLAAPTADEEGMELTITAKTAFAHVVTATNLIDDGVTGGAKDTATFAAFVGSTLTLKAVNLKWVVKSSNNVTIAAV